MILYVFMEEPSMEPVVRHVIGSEWPEIDLRPIAFRGKPDLLKNLEKRLVPYRDWSTSGELRIAVLVDRDSDDCHDLKEHLESMAARAGLPTLTDPKNKVPILVNRVACEELEAWFFGDVPAIRAVFPRIPASLGQRAAYRSPDSIVGGTWERLEKELRAAGYYPGGMPKPDVAQRIAPHMAVKDNRSPSFQIFVSGVRRLLAGEEAAHDDTD